jgi:hypothetical protein
MIWPTIAVLISLAIAALITIPNKTPERHHPSWCHMFVYEIANGRVVATHMMGLPCKYRTNHAIDV